MITIYTFAPSMRQYRGTDRALTLSRRHMSRLAYSYRTMRREGMSAVDARMALVHATNLGKDIAVDAVSATLAGVRS